MGEASRRAYDPPMTRFSGFPAAARSLALLALGATWPAWTACSSPSPAPPPTPSPPGGQGVLHDLRIARHESAVLGDQRADQIVADMGDVLTRVDGEGDVACEVRFRRSGSVATFDAGDGVVNSEADFAQVLAVPGEIKVVRQINWCGTFAPNIIGCAPVPGGSLAVVRFAADQEGILWVHEFGHNKGLQHRGATGAVMNAFIDVTHRRVNDAECRAYEGGAP